MSSPCQFDGKPGCKTMAQAESRFCPRHTYLHNLGLKQAAEKEAARRQKRLEANAGFPKTREEMLRRKYSLNGTKPCGGCGLVVEWWRTPLNRNLPMNPMPSLDSPAVTHFATCTHAKHFRKVSA